MTNANVVRFHFIEVMITWQDRINATHIARHFSISRQMASKTISRYLSIHPNSLKYNESFKCFIAYTHFQCHYSCAEFKEYQQLGDNVTQSQSNQVAIIDIDLPSRNPEPHLVQPILRAISHQQAIEIGYTSLTNPEYKDRIIEPHNLIYDGLRWHVRAYCQKNRDFRDFVLTRFDDEIVEECKATQQISLDILWNTLVDIEIEADQRLSKIQQHVIEKDFRMHQGKLIINTRAALVNYILKRLHLDTYLTEPMAQQIVVTSASRQAIAGYLY